MPIDWREGLEGRWAVVVYSDPYDTAEWLEVMTTILAHPISSAPLRLLIDSRNCATSAADGCARVLSFAEQHRARFVGGAVAIVGSSATPDDARTPAIVAQAQSLKLQLEAFEDWHDAERWLARGGSTNSASVRRHSGALLSTLEPSATARQTTTGTAADSAKKVSYSPPRVIKRRRR